jgi:hypothetical protein
LRPFLGCGTVTQKDDFETARQVTVASGEYKIDASKKLTLTAGDLIVDKTGSDSPATITGNESEVSKIVFSGTGKAKAKKINENNKKEYYDDIGNFPLGSNTTQQNYKWKSSDSTWEVDS